MFFIWITSSAFSEDAQYPFVPRNSEKQRPTTKIALRILGFTPELRDKHVFIMSLFLSVFGEPGIRVFPFSNTQVSGVSGK